MSEKLIPDSYEISLFPRNASPGGVEDFGSSLRIVTREGCESVQLSIPTRTAGWPYGGQKPSLNERLRSFASYLRACADRMEEIADSNTLPQ
jgi:hypothetical protein